MNKENFFKPNQNNNTFYYEMEGSWNFVSDCTENKLGMKRADPETRKRQLEEYKAKEIARLEEQIRKIKNLY